MKGNKRILTFFLVVFFSLCVISSTASNPDSTCVINHVNVYLENIDISNSNLYIVILFYGDDTLMLDHDELRNRIKINLTELTGINLVYQGRVLQVKGFEKYFKIDSCYDLDFEISKTTADCLRIKYTIGGVEFIDGYISPHKTIHCNLLTIKNNLGK